MSRRVPGIRREVLTPDCRDSITTSAGNRDVSRPHLCRIHSVAGAAMTRFGAVGQASRLSRIAKPIRPCWRPEETSYAAVQIDGWQSFETGGTPVLLNRSRAASRRLQRFGCPSKLLSARRSRQEALATFLFREPARSVPTHARCCSRISWISVNTRWQTCGERHVIVSAGDRAMTCRASSICRANSSGASTSSTRPHARA